MACGDVDTFTGRVLVAEVRDPVDRLDGEGVCGVRQQAQHLHLAIQQAMLCWPIGDAVSTGEARSLG